MKMPKDKIQEWCNALRSGEYKQGKGMLKTLDGAYCCLGVACEINGARCGEFTEFPGQDAPEWLKEINQHFVGMTGQSLAHLNDVGALIFGVDSDGSHSKGWVNPFTFDEIADLLEAVYILEVLE